MTRFAFASTLAVAVMLGVMPGVQAQIPPVDDTVDQVEDTANQVGGQVEDTANQVGGQVEDTVNQVGGQVEDTANQVGGQVGDTANQVGGQVGDAVNETANDTVGSVGQAAGAGSTVGAASGLASGSTGGAGETEAEGSSPQGGSGNGAGRGSARERSRAAPTGERGGAGMDRVLSQTSRPSLAPAAFIPLMVRLTNDADGDGSYRDTESAPEPAADVPLRVRVENAGPADLDVTAVRHATSGPFGSAKEAVCQQLVGIRLAPGASAVCRFTAEGLAPGGGDRVVTVVEVDVVEAADPSTTGTVTDTSVVRTEGVSVLGAVARRVLESLATTGGRIAFLLVLSIGLGAAGAWMLRVGNRHDRPIQVLTTGAARTPRRMGTHRPSRPRPPTVRPRSSVKGHAVARRGAARR